MKETDVQPIQLVEDGETGDRFLVYGSQDGMRLDIKFAGDTLWMTQAQIAELFGRDRSVVSKHIGNVFAEGELDENSNVQKMHIAQSAKPVSIFSLDLIISVGYRVSSVQATTFRRWATSVLVQYAKSGFVVDKVRLKDPENADRVRELREIIRDIRSDEANVFRELKNICAMCQDYEPGSTVAQQFYQHTQAKLIHAVVSMTPAEVVHSRADSSEPNMGLQTWPNDNIRKADTTVSKNYLTKVELKELNRLTTILLDIFEDQLDLGRLIVMSDAEKLLDQQLSNLGRVVLRDGGRVKKTIADSKAHTEYEKFKEVKKLERHQEADQKISELAKQAKSLPKTRGKK
ncbi:RhuM family protein [Roseovarius sp. MMSF_3281]|uniref:RhuM family protein n=1 Tax=Roseovarius sp. MMSF_3281 TaxID=3046694 RepID=UPI00273D22A7|nr:RhuM family protein [Roseovarius sp. MMSF_3281]